MISEYLKNDISVILDQGMNNEEMERIKKIADVNQAKLFMYRIEVDEQIRLERLKQRAEKVKQPLMSKETMDILFKIYKENTYPGNKTFDTGSLSMEEIAKSILEDLNK